MTQREGRRHDAQVVKPVLDRASGRVQHALEALAGGEPMVLIDDLHRAGEAMLVAAAQSATPQVIAFVVRHTSGFLRVALPESRCDRLMLPPMWYQTAGTRETSYCVTVDAAAGAHTGISATDRARTIAALADPGSRPDDFTRPGHVVPVPAREGGVTVRPGRTEAVIDLARLAGLGPTGVFAELVSDDSGHVLAAGRDLSRFAAQHHLAVVFVGDVIATRRHPRELLPAHRAPRQAC